MLPDRLHRVQEDPERRRIPRRILRYLRVYSPVPGHIIDLSSLGMCLETAVAVPENVEHSFRIRYRSMLFSFRGQVRWCNPHSFWSSSDGKSRGLYRSGVSFAEELPIESLEFLVDDEAPPTES